jgi:hypothetical protein
MQLSLLDLFNSEKCTNHYFIEVVIEKLNTLCSHLTITEQDEENFLKLVKFIRGNTVF